jgi:hypothetical protein
MNYITNSFTLTYTDSHWTNIVDLSEESLNYFWGTIKEANENEISNKSNLAGNISKSLMLNDSKGMIAEKIIPEIIQSQFDFYCEKLQKNIIDPKLLGFWVNYQKKHEFNPIHSHDGTFSFVIWMQIPYDWENEKNLEIVKDSNTQYNVGNFVFVYCKDNSLHSNPITMNPQMNGKMAIFPSHFNHMVYPFYTSDDYRISISGNIQIN